MIDFFSETEFEFSDEDSVKDWVAKTIVSEGLKEGDLTFIFCDDVYLHKINLEFLNHDTLTDIITFDYTLGKEIHGEIYISIDRVKENASEYKVSFNEELHRVIIHGVLHLCGYKDKSEADESQMRFKENFYLQAFQS
ncbi:rRNA maturation RNase YbeY [Aureisphaera sp. CAU 1614]|uniref:Endoribonuclease YbeY n=1 Tax=Halomarinibacterium sedimenti TaxID=2857106 RepID=A0A9X1FN48_9FLAO|nr:rRNA maturation RNase YbeY [Halomarinibacterium sedimenti]MBW2937268.1 rRNA maturation RNase YbeY [Halomarinibacterium sedimenti]